MPGKVEGEGEEEAGEPSVGDASLTPGRERGKEGPQAAVQL